MENSDDLSLRSSSALISATDVPTRALERLLANADHTKIRDGDRGGILRTRIPMVRDSPQVDPIFESISRDMLAHAAIPSAA